jgi:hypothetical protein
VTASREDYEERAAIREWLGKVPRDDAERGAEEDARRWWPTRRALPGARGT